MVRVAVAGSHDISPLVAGPMFKMIARLDRPAVLLRRGRKTGPGPLEEALAEMCRSVGCAIEWHVPAPGGRDQVFFRDIDMVSNADLLLAVFTAERPMEGGTGHLVEKAIDQRVPAYAFTWTGEELARLGEFDPDDTWGVALSL